MLLLNQTTLLQNQLAETNREHVAAQRQFTACKQMLRKHMEKVPVPKVSPTEMHFLPNPNNNEFICYLGLENVVDYLTNNNQNFTAPEPFECVQCGTDFTPVWKWQDRSDPAKASVICEECVNKNIKKTVAEEHVKRVIAFGKVQEELEKQLATAEKLIPTAALVSANNNVDFGPSAPDSNAAALAHAQQQQQSQSLQQQHHAVAAAVQNMSNNLSNRSNSNNQSSSGGSSSNLANAASLFGTNFAQLAGLAQSANPLLAQAALAQAFLPQVGGSNAAAAVAAAAAASAHQMPPAAHSSSSRTSNASANASSNILANLANMLSGGNNGGNVASSNAQSTATTLALLQQLQQPKINNPSMLMMQNLQAQISNLARQNSSSNASSSNASSAATGSGNNATMLALMSQLIGPQFQMNAVYQQNNAAMMAQLMSQAMAKQKTSSTGGGSSSNNNSGASGSGSSAQSVNLTALQRQFLMEMAGTASGSGNGSSGSGNSSGGHSRGSTNWRS